MSDAPPLNAAAAPKRELPSASPLIWTVLAAAGAASLGFCRAVSRDDFLLFSALSQDGLAALRHIEIGSLVRDAIAFGAAGAIAPRLIVALAGGRRTCSKEEAIVSLSRPFAVGLLGWAILASLFGFRAPDADIPGREWLSGDFKEIWATWFAALIGLTAAFFVHAATRVAAQPATPETPATSGEGDDVETEQTPARFWDAGAIAMALLALAYASAFAWMSAARYLAFNVGLHDLGIYDQLAWNLGQGEGFRVTHYYLEAHGNNYLAEHFMPVMILLAPLRRLWDSPSSILAAQALAVGGAGWFLYAFARRETGSSLLALALGASFLCHPFIQQATMKDFHADALEPLFLFAALWAGRKEGSPAAYAAFLLLLMSCKEDASLAVAALGVFQLSRGDWKRGLPTIVGALAWHLAAMRIIMDARGGEPLRHLYRYDHLAGGKVPGGVGDIAAWCLANPVQAIATCATPERVRSLLLVFAPTLFAALLAPRAWLLLALPFAAGLGSNWHLQYRMELHYGVSPTMFAYAAATFALGWWTRRAESDRPRRLARRNGAAAGTLLLALSLFLEHGRAPGGRRFDAADFQRDPRWNAALPMIDAIPAGAAVSATNELAIRLAGRRDLYEYPTVPPDAEFLLLDCGSEGVSYHLPDRAEFEASVRAILGGSEWGLLQAAPEEGFLLFQRGKIDRLSASETSAKLNFAER